MKRLRRLDAIGALAGLAFGVADAWLLTRLGVEWVYAGRDATPIVAAWFGGTTALLGWLAGRLALQRARARADAETIREQSRALQAQRRIAVQNEKLAAIGRLAAGIAHEVRNPLGVIRSSAAMIQEGFAAKDDAHRACSFICEEIDRLDGLITSLLDFARPVELRQQEVALGGVVERAVKVAGPSIEGRGVHLDLEAGRPGPGLRADPDLLAQVVLDLLTNAAEAVPDDGRIVVRAAAAGGAVHLEVADSGPGVPESISERVFEPFFTTKPRGTGLGLAMAARIAQAHGGHIEVVSGRGAGTRGDGACFRLVLPATPAAAPGARA